MFIYNASFIFQKELDKLNSSKKLELFTEKEVTILDLDNSFSIGDELWLDDLNDYIVLETKLIKVRIS